MSFQILASCLLSTVRRKTPESLAAHPSLESLPLLKRALPATVALLYLDTKLSKTTMKFSSSALASLFVLTASFDSTQAFGLKSSTGTSFLPSRHYPSAGPLESIGQHTQQLRSTSRRSISALNMQYTVGIVGATGAVGKEIRQCLETRNFPVSKLRIFGSERSAGKTMETDKYGSITVELFDVEKARECDVVFLAVSGDFALEHAKALTENDGCVCIDNSVGLHPSSRYAAKKTRTLTLFRTVCLPIR